MSLFEFQSFEKIPRYKNDVYITEKIDGTNSQIAIFELDCKEAFDAAFSDPYCIATRLNPGDGALSLAMYAGSRKRWIAPEGSIYEPEDSYPTNGIPVKGTDNFGFARWVKDNAGELFKLGPGRHFGEWYGLGIQRGYGLSEKHFALFNPVRWGPHNPNTPACCEVVTRVTVRPSGEPATNVPTARAELLAYGSQHVPGFDNPEGIIVYHTASRQLFKQTFEKDSGKWKDAA